MSYIKYLSILLILSSCNLSQSVKTKQDEEARRLKDAGLEKTLVICNVCNGAGKVKMDTGERIGFAIVTFGFGAMCTDGECERCKGKGVETVIRKSKTKKDERIN